MSDPTPTPATTKANRRWYQYSLRTLLIVVTLLAIPFWYVGEQYRIVQHRKAVRDHLSGGIVIVYAEDDDGLQPPPAISWIRRYFGDEPIGEITYKPSVSASDIDELRDAFPEAYISPFYN